MSREAKKQFDSPALRFLIEAQSGDARAGVLTTRRGKIETPVFMPVGTAGTVKGIRFEALESADLDAKIILGNTYHLWLRPGIDVIKSAGGLHRFIGWERALLTDSGGFQVWSLGALRKISEEGTEFRSHVDGSLRFLSPEVSMEVQAALGSDIVMVFDECAPGEASHDETERSLSLTARWAKRSKMAFDRLQADGADTGRVKAEGLSGAQALFGIIQGAGNLDLRRTSLEQTVNIGFDGYAIGGLSVGEEKSVMFEVIDDIAPRMPNDRPRYLMGVGTPEDLVEAVARGIDMFDCVLPTRNGRHGVAFTRFGPINLKNARHADDPRPLDIESPCPATRNYSRAYLHHLVKANEMLGARLNTLHNLYFYLDLMRQMRVALDEGRFAAFA